MDKEEDVVSHDNETFTLIVKSATQKEEIEVEADSTIAKFKELVAVKFNADVQSLRLIYAGRILKDADTIRCLSIKNGYTICVVVKSTPQIENARPNYETSTTVPNLQDPLSRNLWQHYTGGPDIIQSILNNNPTIQQIIQRNPEVGHMINNPALLRQAVDIMRNPNVASEFRRSADRAMSNIESLPDGFNALQQMYYDIEEPLMNVGNNISNPFTSLFPSQPSGQHGTENRAPLPNPWSPNTSTQEETNSDVLESPLNSNTLEPLQNLTQQPDNASLLLMLQDMYTLLSNTQMTETEEFATLQQQLNDLLPETLQQNSNNQQSENRAYISPDIINSLPTLLLANVMRRQSPSSETSNNNAPNSDIIAQLLSQLNVQSRPNNSVQEERYRSQMQQLSEMGFENQEANLQALIASFGDLNGAIERLLSRNLIN